MGYRNWICRVRKDVDLVGLQDYDYCYAVTERIYELGKYVDFEPEIILDLYEDQESPDGEYAIMDVDEIKKIVKWYSSLHLDYLKNLLKTEDELSPEEKLDYEFYGRRETPTSYVEKQIKRWEDPENMIYNNDLNSSEIVKSWDFQYEIFELLHIYKTWDHNYWMVWYGG